MWIQKFFTGKRTHPMLELSQEMIIHIKKMLTRKTTSKERRKCWISNSDFLSIPGSNVKSIHVNSVLCPLLVSNHFDLIWSIDINPELSRTRKAWVVTSLKIFPKLIFFCIRSNLFLDCIVRMWISLFLIVRLWIYLILFWLVGLANQSIDWCIIARASISRSLLSYSINAMDSLPTSSDTGGEW